MLNGEEAVSFSTLAAVADAVSGRVVTDKLKEMTEADHAGPVGQWKDSGFSSKRDFKGKGRRSGGSCWCPAEREPWLDTWGHSNEGSFILDIIRKEEPQCLLSFICRVSENEKSQSYLLGVGLSNQNDGTK